MLWLHLMLFYLGLMHPYQWEGQNDGHKIWSKQTAFFTLCSGQFVGAHLVYNALRISHHFLQKKEKRCLSWSRIRDFWFIPNQFSKEEFWDSYIFTRLKGSIGRSGCVDISTFLKQCHW
jgi:hypothetical protein